MKNIKIRTLAESGELLACHRWRLMAENERREILAENWGEMVV
ncbi:MAG: hypothetical protein UDB11_08310 [Peptococcaceae bacterium]|nr:hypothetical protein [Peptococcaceae bacterium]